MYGAAKRKLDQRIAELERRLDGLRALRAAMDDSEVAAEIAGVFAQNGKQSSKRTRKSGSNMDKLRKFYANRDNAWATLVEIVDATKISRHSLRQIVYRSNVDEFDRNGARGGGRQSRFRLKADSSQEAQ